MADQDRSGFRVGYEVRNAPGKGRGVFACDAVPEGLIVWRFVPGLFEVYDETGFYALLRPMSHDEAVYVLTHSFGFGDLPGCVIRVLDDGALINHAAPGNLVTGFDIPMRTKPDPTSPGYLGQVREALCEDRFALLSSRAIAAGEELTNDYSKDLSEPEFFDRLYADYGIVDDYLE